MASSRFSPKGEVNAVNALIEGLVKRGLPPAFSAAQNELPSEDPQRDTIVLVFFFSDLRESRFLEHPPTRRPIQRRVPDDAFDFRDRARALDQRANRLRRISTAPR